MEVHGIIANPLQAIASSLMQKSQKVNENGLRSL
jgi:hypothetical protein